MAKRLIEEIILKVGVDATGVSSGLADLDKRLKSVEGQFGKTEKANEENTAAQKKAIPIAKKTGLAMADLDSKLDSTEAGFNKLSNALKKYRKESKGANKSTGFLSGNLGKIGAAIGVAGVIGVVTSRITALTQAAQDADRLGVVAQNLINLQNIGRTFGATAEDVTQGIKNINESASEAFKDASGEKFELFEELNIDLERFNELKPDEQFEAFSRSINGVENQGRRTAIQLALMGEEGFKLAVTMDELATNAEAAKLKVEGFTGSLNTEELEKLNKSLVESKLRFEGVFNQIVGFGANAFNAVGDSIDKVSFSLFGVLKLHEDLLDVQNAQIEVARKLNIQREEDAKKDKLAIEKKIKDQKELTELLRLATEELNDPKRLADIENSPEIQAKFKKEQERLEDVKKRARLNELIAQRKEEKQQEKSKARALKTIADIGLSRKKEFLKRLQEESKRGGGAGIVEAGSIEAAEIEASLQNRDLGKISKIETIKKQIDAEEKAKSEERLKVAKETLEAIKNQKNQIKINTRPLS